jgi:hypothetical protein
MDIAGMEFPAMPREFRQENPAPRSGFQKPTDLDWTQQIEEDPKTIELDVLDRKKIVPIVIIDVARPPETALVRQDDFHAASAILIRRLTAFISFAAGVPK